MMALAVELRQAVALARFAKGGMPPIEGGIRQALHATCNHCRTGSFSSAICRHPPCEVWGSTASRIMGESSRSLPSGRPSGG